MQKTILMLMTWLFIGLPSTNAQWSDQEIETKINEILPQLTLREKVDLCHAQSKFSTAGVERLGIPELWMADGPHGVRAEISWDSWNYAGWTNDSITAFPALTCLAATFNEKLAYQFGKALGEEARYRKKDVILGPGVNIYRTPLNGRNFEYMGEDPLLASKLCVPYIHGVQENGVAACIKHYVLNNQELWRDHINVEVSDRALYEIYLPAFKAAVQQGGAWSLMGAYNQFRGQYCCHNEILLNDILKDDWGFDGVVITDWGGAHDTRESALYGLDIEMGTGTNGLTFSESNAYQNYFLAAPFYEMLKNGDIPESVVDDKVRRILRLMFRTNMAKTRPLGSINTEAHQDVARRVAQEGIVLLKNEEGFFPIDPTKKLTIAVIGENATRQMTKGGGSSELKPQFEISPLEGMKERFKNATIIHSMGYASGDAAYGRVLPPPYDLDSLKQAALKVAAEADIVLFFGGLNKNHHQDCEGGDRLQYGLDFGQEELIQEIARVNSNLGVVLISGNAVAMPWLDHTKALIQGWYLGSMAGHAMADIISGDINPSGKLPFTFPVKLEDNGAHHYGKISYPGDNINQEYLEDILVGYRWHDTRDIAPQFAFGYGLSYTDFSISDITTNGASFTEEDKLQVSFKVNNKGDTDGAEVVQLYIGKENSSVPRAQKELKGYQKVAVKAGKSTIGSIEINIKDLSYYDENIDNWNLEKGAYTLYIGNSSNNITFKKQFNVR